MLFSKQMLKFEEGIMWTFFRLFSLRDLRKCTINAHINSSVFCSSLNRELRAAQPIAGWSIQCRAVSRPITASSAYSSVLGKYGYFPYVS